MVTAAKSLPMLDGPEISKPQVSPNLNQPPLVTNQSCDNREQNEKKPTPTPPVTVIPAPSSYTLVAEDQQLPPSTSDLSFAMNEDSLDNFEDDIAPVECRPRPLPSSQNPFVKSDPHPPVVAQPAPMPTVLTPIGPPTAPAPMSATALTSATPVAVETAVILDPTLPPGSVTSMASLQPVMSGPLGTAMPTVSAAQAAVLAAASAQFVCPVCQKECYSENELNLHKKRHDKDSPMICEYCNQAYTNRHRFEVHVRYHTGETPFKCHICGKGFRDNRKMKLHVGRHNNTLPNKCHLCPRSFEGPKALQKHIVAHQMGRYVQPKVITNPDGTTTMALPFSDAGNSNLASISAAPASATTNEQHPLTLTASVIANDGQMLALGSLQPISPAAAAAMAAASPVGASVPPHMATMVPTAPIATITSASAEDDQATISLSMDDLMQYAQPVPDNVIHEENGLEDKLTAGATTKYVPLNMDEFIKTDSMGSGGPGGHLSKTSESLPMGGPDAHNDSGEFPDLLDSESNLESLSYAATRPKSEALKVHEDVESGLTFATLSGVKPDYPEGVVPNENIVVARKSAAAPVVKAESIVAPGSSQPAQPLTPQQQQQQQATVLAAAALAASGSNAGGEVPGNIAQVKTEDLMNVLAGEAMNQLAKQIKLPAGTCLVPADAKCEPVFTATGDQTGQLEVLSTTLAQTDQADGAGAAGGSTNPMTITIQYKIYPDSQSEPQKVAVQRDLADIINEAPPETIDKITAAMANATQMSGAAAGPSGVQPVTAPSPVPVGPTPGPPTPTPPSSVGKAGTTKVKPVGPDINPSELPAIPVHQTGPDPSKDTRKVISPSGKEFDVPSLVISGYDLDKLMCTFCNKSFKNDKTLMSHMLHHFGVTPKMASCPICGLTLQKKSYARHMRLHGNVVPEICPYCNKEFREKRSLDKHIRAIHQAERPYACPIPDCHETFRNQVELKNHHNRHIKDYPFECDRCTMTFQKQDSLTTHYRSHTGEKPFVCEICDKSFTSEKNKKVHVQRHQGSLPHKCDICSMTFQSRSHLIKHATSHNRKPPLGQPYDPQTIQPANTNKINNFLESFSASLGDDMLGGMDDTFEAGGSGAKVGDDGSVRLSVDTIPESLEAAAAEAAFALNQQDIPEELLRTSEAGDSMVINVLPSATAVALGQATPQDQGSFLQCDICLTKLKDKRAYIIHMKKHAGTLSLKCKLCGIILMGQTNFNKHMRTSHNVDPSTVQAIVMEEEESFENDDESQSSESFRGQSGRGSVASSTFDPLGPSGSTEVKCALCPEVFSTHELLQKHTASHFDEKQADDILREKLLQQTMRKKKKKKKKSVAEAPPPLPLSSTPLGQAAPVASGSSSGTKSKYRKTYSCLLCDTTFIKKASWRIHKIRHNGKGWKCQFCSELHETSETLKVHLATIHKMDSEEMEMLGIIKTANMFVVTKKLKVSKEKSKPSQNSDSSSADSDSDSDDDDDDDEDEIDYEEDEDEEDDTTTNSSTPTPFSIASLPQVPLTSVAQINTTARPMQPLMTTDVLAAAVSAAKNQPPVMTPQHAPSPTPSSSSGSNLPTLKFIEDESLFDLDALTCHACNKSFKNTRAFKLHRDRHQGALKHKCPECIKTFNGRSEVNRHMIAIHARPLNPDEDTLHKRADQNKQLQFQQQLILQQQRQLQQSQPEVDSMAMTINASDILSADRIKMLTTTSPLPAMMPQVPLPISVASTLTTSTLDLNTTSTISTVGTGLMLTSTPAPPESKTTSMTTLQPIPMLDMPSLIEPEPQPKAPEEPVQDFSNISEGMELDPETGMLVKSKEENEESKDAEETTSTNTLIQPGMMPVLDEPPPPKVKAPEPKVSTGDKDFEAFIAAKPVKASLCPRPDLEEEEKTSEKAPEKVLEKVPDESSVKATEKVLPEKIKSSGSTEEKCVKVTSPKAQEMIEDNFESKGDDDTTSENLIPKVDQPKDSKKNVKAEKARKSPRSEQVEISATPEKSKTTDDTLEIKAKKEDTEIEKSIQTTIENDLEKETKKKVDKKNEKNLVEKAEVKEDEPVNEDDESATKESEDSKSKSDPEPELPPRRRGRSQQASPLVTPIKRKEKREKVKPESESPADPDKESPSQRKRRGRPKRTPEPSTSEDSCHEKEKENSGTSSAITAESGVKEEKFKTNKLLKQKGVSLNKEGKVMIPSHKLTLPEELCQIVENRKGKKMYQCQICSKEFNRKDIINYHVYTEHREDFLEYGKGLPEVLTREENESPPSKGSSNNAAAAVFKRIFKPKMMSGNKDSGRKGQVEISVKSKSGSVDDDDDDEDRRLRTKELEEKLEEKRRMKSPSPARPPSTPPYMPPPKSKNERKEVETEGVPDKKNENKAKASLKTRAEAELNETEASEIVEKSEKPEKEKKSKKDKKAKKEKRDKEREEGSNEKEHEKEIKADEDSSTQVKDQVEKDKSLNEMEEPLVRTSSRRSRKSKLLKQTEEEPVEATADKDEDQKTEIKDEEDSMPSRTRRSKRKSESLSNSKIEETPEKSPSRRKRSPEKKLDESSEKLDTSNESLTPSKTTRSSKKKTHSKASDETIEETPEKAEIQTPSEVKETEKESPRSDSENEKTPKRVSQRSLRKAQKKLSENAPLEDNKVEEASPSKEKTSTTSPAKNSEKSSPKAQKISNKEEDSVKENASQDIPEESVRRSKRSQRKTDKAKSLLEKDGKDNAIIPSGSKKIIDKDAQIVLEKINDKRLTENTGILLESSTTTEVSVKAASEKVMDESSDIVKENIPGESVDNEKAAGIKGNKKVVQKKHENASVSKSDESTLQISESSESKSLKDEPIKISPKKKESEPQEVVKESAEKISKDSVKELPSSKLSEEKKSPVEKSKDLRTASTSVKETAEENDSQKPVEIAEKSTGNVLDIAPTAAPQIEVDKTSTGKVSRKGNKGLSSVLEKVIMAKKAASDKSLPNDSDHGTKEMKDDKPGLNENLGENKVGQDASIENPTNKASDKLAISSTLKKSDHSEALSDNLPKRSEKHSRKQNKPKKVESTESMSPPSKSIEDHGPLRSSKRDTSEDQAPKVIATEDQASDNVTEFNPPMSIEKSPSPRTRRGRNPSTSSNHEPKSNESKVSAKLQSIEELENEKESFVERPKRGKKPNNTSSLDLSSTQEATEVSTKEQPSKEVASETSVKEAVQSSSYEAELLSQVTKDAKSVEVPAKEIENPQGPKSILKSPVFVPKMPEKLEVLQTSNDDKTDEKMLDDHPQNTKDTIEQPSENSSMTAMENPADSVEPIQSENADDEPQQKQTKGRRGRPSRKNAVPEVLEVNKEAEKTKIEQDHIQQAESAETSVENIKDSVDKQAKGRKGRPSRKSAIPEAELNRDQEKAKPVNEQDESSHVESKDTSETKKGKITDDQEASLVDKTQSEVVKESDDKVVEEFQLKPSKGRRGRPSKKSALPEAGPVKDEEETKVVHEQEESPHDHTEFENVKASEKTDQETLVESGEQAAKDSDDKALEEQELKSSKGRRGRPSRKTAAHEDQVNAESVQDETSAVDTEISQTENAQQVLEDPQPKPMKGRRGRPSRKNAVPEEDETKSESQPETIVEKADENEDLVKRGRDKKSRVEVASETVKTPKQKVNEDAADLAKVEKDKTAQETIIEATLTIETSPPKVEDQDKVESFDGSLFENLKGRKGRTGRKINSFLLDVNQLIGYQEQQRRLRNRTLLDSSDAVKLLKKYRKRKRKRFIVKQNPDKPLTLKVEKVSKKPIYAVEKQSSDPKDFKLTISLKKDTTEPKSVSKEDKLETDKPSEENPAPEPPGASSKVETSVDEEVPKTKKRGRPSRKANIELETKQESSEEPSEAKNEQPMASPPSKRRFQDSRNEESKDESKTTLTDQSLDVIDAQPTSLKKRGRPPKKAILSEIEVGLDLNQSENLKSLPENPKQKVAEEVSKEIISEDATKTNLPELNEDKNLVKKRGRPSKRAAETSKAQSEDKLDTIPTEPIEKVLEDEAPTPAKRRAVKEPVADQKQNKLQEEAPEKSPLMPLKIDLSKRTDLVIYDKLEGVKGDKKSESIKDKSSESLKSPRKESSSEINDNRYVVQHVDANPLKIKLKSGMTTEPLPKAPIKLKLNLSKDSDEAAIKKAKKHKKKKMRDRSPGHKHKDSKHHSDKSQEEGSPDEKRTEERLPVVKLPVKVLPVKKPSAETPSKEKDPIENSPVNETPVENTPEEKIPKEKIPTEKIPTEKIPTVKLLEAKQTEAEKSAEVKISEPKVSEKIPEEQPQERPPPEPKPQIILRIKSPNTINEEISKELEREASKKAQKEADANRPKETPAQVPKEPSKEISKEVPKNSNGFLLNNSRVGNVATLSVASTTSTASLPLKKRHDDKSNKIEADNLSSTKERKSTASTTSSDPGATSAGMVMTFSPESSPEHSVQTNFFLQKDHAEIGLGEGQFKDLMKAIDSDEEAGASAKRAAWIGGEVASTSAASASVKQSQVDGACSEASWSRSSSISQSSPLHLSADEDDSYQDEAKPQQSVIIKRMKQIQGRPKTKSCLIRHVFSAVAKKRKIVVVRYRKPEQRIFDREEYFERCASDRLNDPYDEDTEDPTMFKPAKVSKAAKQQPTPSASPSLVPAALDEDEWWRDDPAYLESLKTLTCLECGRSLPNTVRMHAHLQMHHESKKRRKSKDEDRIDQLDGANDLYLDNSKSSTASSVVPSTSASTSGTPTTHLYILKSQDAKVYQCSQCPEVFPGQKALLTHQSLVHHDSLTSTIFPCQQCSIGFRDANSLEQHMRNEHGKQQIVTIIQADLPRDTGSSAESSGFGSGSSSCSSSTTSSHPASAASSSSGFFTSQRDALGVIAGNTEGVPSSILNNPLLKKQDPVLMFNSEDEQDLMLDESLNLFETSSLIDSGDSAIHLSLDDLANFAPPMVAADGSHTSFDTSMETSSFLSGADALDIINDASNVHTPLSIDGCRSSGAATSGSRTPSVSDDGEFPCTQCEKRFGNRRNLLSHMRRHTGDFKLFCDHCNKGFFTQSKLESHKRKHTGKFVKETHLKDLVARF